MPHTKLILMLKRRMKKKFSKQNFYSLFGKFCCSRSITFGENFIKFTELCTSLEKIYTIFISVCTYVWIYGCMYV